MARSAVAPVSASLAPIWANRRSTAAAICSSMMAVRPAAELAIAFAPIYMPSACIAFTISNAIGELVFVAACCDFGVLRCGLWTSHRGVRLFRS